MKKPNLTFIATIGCFLTTITACNKAQVETGCPLLYNGQRPPGVTLQLVDKQNRDLLNPATPNYYDTTAIEQLNTMPKVGIIPTGTAENKTGNIEIRLYPDYGESTTIYSLSNTDRDTIVTNLASKLFTSKQGCYYLSQYIAFKYNGKSYTDTLSTGHFIIVK